MGAEFARESSGVRQALRLPTYRRLLGAYGLNELAWTVGTLALAVLVYRHTGSALGSTAFFLCSMVAPAFVSPLVVARLDQRAPRRMLPFLYALEGILFGVLAWMTARFSLVPVLALVLADGIVAIVARALARTATVNVLRPAGLLHEGNALTNVVFSVCFMTGPLIGGIVVAAGGTIAALLVNCGLFVGVAVILSTATGLTEVPPAEESSGRLRAAVRHVRQDRALRWLLLLQGAGVVAFTMSVPVEVVLAQHSLHAGAAGYGAMLSGWGAGAVVGSAAYARWRRRSARALIALSGAALGSGFALMAGAPTIAVAVVGAAIGGAGNGVESTAARTALQEYTPQRWMAVVMSLNESVNQGAPGIGILLGGGITQLSNPRVALGIAGAGSLVFAAAVWVVLRPSAMPGRPVEPEETAGAADDLLPTAPPSRETIA